MDRMERDRQEAQVREAERERAFDHTPLTRSDAEEAAKHAERASIPLHELPVQGGSWGMGLWARVRGLGGPYWHELDDRQRIMWGQAERFVWHHERMRRKPGPLRFELEPGEPVSTYERHLQAVEAVLRRTLPAFPWITDEWLHETAEAVLGAAETGF